MEAAKLATSVNFITLTRFLMDLTGDKELTILMGTLALACKATSRACAHAGIAGLLGQAGDQNASGDDQKKLDVLSNDIFVNALKNSGTCAVLVSEEDEDPIIVDEGKQGSFCVAFDPLDGSSNIDCNISTGTIFAVYRKETDGPPTPADILRTGEDIVAAGYCMYGAATELVLCFKGQGVHRFTLDQSVGEFIHFQEIKMPADGGKKIYSCNEGNSSKWDSVCLKSVEYFRDNGYSARYVGSMVADVHRTLLYGGIFLYPADSKSPNGKLRVLYEGFPMALIVEEAGGLASTGMFKGALHRMLALQPSDIHERCPVILGAVRDVERVLDMYNKASL
eukprot:TRINITY_DN1683_c0_g1_i1.p2 TRINITY_DN1683_c0_g1~~TRINITY_DN1683_c0_g1_i1.p2  ORF type:complete len:337 (-),score=107.56 TRINITY_DN1683_c0_g1_i1:293-1303(-)